jgi:hypothetical protein
MKKGKTFKTFVVIFKNGIMHTEACRNRKTAKRYALIMVQQWGMTYSDIKCIREVK